MDIKQELAPIVTAREATVGFNVFQSYVEQNFKDPGNEMSMSSESSDGEENAPAMFPFEVFPKEPRIEKTISSHNKKMLATGGFTFYFGYSTTLHVKQANGNINQTPAEVYHCSERLRRTCKESHQRVLRLSQGIGLAETSNLAQKRKVEEIKEALAVFNPEEISNSMARMANAIDDIQLDDLSFDGS
uniref:Uncharacterized protein n=1 Tax=Ditylenchus dipsaci TaxID=166011 RepID=A0A915CQB3_9BILA